MRWRGWSLIVLGVILTGCVAPSVTPTVTRFVQPSLVVQGKTFTILPQDAQRGSLEFETYAQMVQRELENLGMRPTVQKGDYVVMLTYSASPPRQEIGSRTDYVPVRRWEPCHGRRSGWRGLCKDTDYVPVSRPESYTVWSHTMQAILYDGPRFRTGVRQSAWEGQSRIDTQSPDFSPAASYLIHALFINFPGPSGIPQHYDIPIQ